MAALVKLRNIITPIASRKPIIFHNFVRHKTLTKYDWAPGPYPETEAERRAAAEKYNLTYEEYKPYPKDHIVDFGDYPMLPKIGEGLRDDYYPWDMPGVKHNYGEPLHVEWIIMTDERCNFGEKPRISHRWMTFWTIVPIAVYTAINFLLKPYPCFRPVLEKQFPMPGVTHYTFESAH